MRGVHEAASTQVLEAVTVLSVMLSSVVFVVTLDVHPAHAGEPRAALDRVARDALAILNDTPLSGSTLGNNVLEVAVQECLQNDCARIESRMGTLLPEGAQWAMYLSTADGLYPVRAARSPPGEAVTARRLIEPNWSYQFLSSAQSIHNLAADPVVIYGLPVVSGNPLHEGGHGLRITVHGNDSLSHAVFVMQGAASTRAVDPTEAPAPAATSVFFHDAGAPLAALDARGTTIAAPATPTGNNLTLELRVEESAGGVVPAGSIVTVQVPRGWRAWGADAENAGHWTILSNATEKNGTAAGSAVVARLAHSVSAGSVDFVLHATYLGDVNDHYPFSATLSAGAYAQAQLLVRADAHVSAPAYEVPVVLASVPRPLGASAVTTWTLAALASDEVDVTRVEIVEDAGRSVFAGVTGLSGGGAWTTTGDKLVWTGEATLGHDAPLALAFEVESAAIEGRASDRPTFVPTVDLGDYTGRLLTEVSPGFFRGAFPPADATYGGYDTSTGFALHREHDATSEAVYRTIALPGTASYGVGYGASLGDSVFGAAVSPRERAVRPGETAQLDVEVQSVAYELAVLDLEPSVDVHVYPPWSGDERTPIVSEALYDASLAAGVSTFLDLLDEDGDGAPDVTDVGRYTVEVPIPMTWLYGPYVVEARLTWLEEISETVDGVPLVEEVTRTASVFDYFVVEPTHGPLPPAPLYDVHLVVWFDDWA